MSLKFDDQKTDKAGYDEYYNVEEPVDGLNIHSREEYIEYYVRTAITPFNSGGTYKGYPKGLAIQTLIENVEGNGLNRSDVTVVDAGCGVGKLSVYLACIGFNVIGVDISVKGCHKGEYLAKMVGVTDNCTFKAESLEKVSIADNSVDFVIGSASLHHFIKYGGVPPEFKRIMKKGAKGFFTDAFSENPFYRLFHNKEKMERLGDVLLNKKLVETFFSDFSVNLTPTDWFVMLDKLYVKVLPKSMKPILRRLSKVHYWLDRHIPVKNRVSLYLSGTIMTQVENNNQ